MSKSAIYTVQTGIPTVADGDIIPLGTIIRRYGQNVRQDGNAITICDKPNCPGYYKVDIVVTAELAATDPYKVSLQKDGVDVIGAEATFVNIPATTPVPFVISALVKNACGGTASLSVKLTGGEAKIENMTVVVEKL